MQIRVARNARKLMFASLSQKEKRHMQPYASVMQGRFTSNISALLKLIYVEITFKVLSIDRSCT